MNSYDLIEEIKDIRQLLRSQAQKRLTCQLIFEVVTDLTQDLGVKDRQVRARLGHLQSIITSHMAWKGTAPDDAAPEMDAAAENTGCKTIPDPMEKKPVPVLIMHLTNGATFAIPDPVRILHHASGEVMGWIAAPQVVTDVITDQLSRGHRSGAVSTESSDYSWSLSLFPAAKANS